jgi:hypothetical protein
MNQNHRERRTPDRRTFLEDVEVEEKEHELFDEPGFQNTVSELTRLEQALGINQLASFTP